MGPYFPPPVAAGYPRPQPGKVSRAWAVSAQAPPSAAGLRGPRDAGRNHHHGHTALKGTPPASRVINLSRTEQLARPDREGESGVAAGGMTEGESARRGGGGEAGAGGRRLLDGDTGL